MKDLLEISNAKETNDTLVGWTTVTLSDPNLFLVGTGGTPDTTKPEYYGGDILWLKSGDIRDVYIENISNRISKLGLEDSNARIYPIGTVMLAMSGRGKTRGTSAVLRVPSACSQSVAAIVPLSDRILPEFVHFNFAHRYEELRNLTGSMDRSGLNLGIIRNIRIHLPPLSEQRTIAHTLQTVQQAIQTRRKELELERERKATLMHHLFTHGTRNEPTKQSEVGEIPESWEIVPFGSLCQFLQYGTSKLCNDEIDGLPVLRIPNVINGYIDTQDLKFTKLPEKTMNSLSLEMGDLLFVRTNGNRAYAGRCAVFNGELERALFASYLIRARLDSKAILPQFAQFYTMIDKGQRYLSGQASNAADGKFNINTQTIKNIRIVIPSLKEQKFIIEIIKACDTKIAALEKEITLHEELIRALLDELMTGRISTLPLVEQLEKGTLTYGQRTPDGTGTTH